MTSRDRGTIQLEKMRAACFEMGLAPLHWDEVVTQAKQRLPDEKIQQFLRYHRNFIAYPTEATLIRFYGFAYGEGLGDLLAKFRFDRLTRLMAWLEMQIPMDVRILEVGAGTGRILHWLQSQKQPKRLSATDLAPGASHYWPAGVAEPMEKESFDILLCLDSLGECHADEDDTIKTMGANSLEEMASIIEQRYGFAVKLNPLRRYLEPHSRLLLAEPIPYPLFWKALAMGLQQEGWAAEIISLPKGVQDTESFGLKLAIL
jgi:SAM-dependent methyltransferase